MKKKIIITSILLVFIIIIIGGVLIYLPKIKNKTLDENKMTDKEGKEGSEWIISDDKVYYKHLGFDNTTLDYKTVITQKEVLGVDIKSFQILNYIYAKDKSNVYAEGRKIENADSNTFEVLNSHPPALSGQVAKDKNRVYYAKLGDFFNYLSSYEIEKILGADSSTFETLLWGYAKDNNDIFYENMVLHNVDLCSFEVLNLGYAKDKNKIYYHESVVEADYETFISLKERHTSRCDLMIDYDAEDKNSYYNFGKINVLKIDKKNYIYKCK